MLMRGLANAPPKTRKRGPDAELRRRIKSVLEGATPLADFCGWVMRSRVPDGPLRLEVEQVWRGATEPDNLYRMLLDLYREE